MDLNLHHRTAIVTGGATGLGKEFVLSLAREGVNICFTYMRDEERPEQLIATVKSSASVEIIAVKTDLSDEHSRENLFATCLERLGNADILVNNAGIWLSGYVTEITQQEWDSVMNVNLKAVFHLSQLFVNHCLAKDQAGSRRPSTVQPPVMLITRPVRRVWWPSQSRWRARWRSRKSMSTTSPSASWIPR